MIYTIKYGNMSAKIDRRGAQLISLTDGSGEERMWCADPKYWNRCSPMLFPICGRLVDNKYTYGGKEYEMSGHGFARDLDWCEVEVREDRLKLSISENEDTLSVYPFKFRICAEFGLTEGGLSLKVTVSNTGDEVLPYMYGWHPGFNLYGEKNSDNYIELPEAGDIKIYKLQHGSFPTTVGEAYALDNKCVRIRNEEIGPADTLIFRDAGCKTVLRTDGLDKKVVMTYSENLPVLCLWKVPDEGAGFICIEPWSDTPSDGEQAECFDTRKMSRLAAGDSAVYEYNISF